MLWVAEVVVPFFFLSFLVSRVKLKRESGQDASLVLSLRKKKTKKIFFFYDSIASLLFRLIVEQKPSYKYVPVFGIVFIGFSGNQPDKETACGRCEKEGVVILIRLPSSRSWES